MNPNDFRYMWRGRALRGLSSAESTLLAPISQKTTGHDRALLLLHGFASSPAVYRAMIPSLTVYDALFCPTLPGHGDSIAAFSVVKSSDWIKSAEEACATLLQNYTTVDVMGLSLGGLLGCHLSLRFPLNHLYLLAPALALTMNVSLALKGAQLLRFFGMKSIRNLAGNLCSKRYSELTYRQLPVTAIIEVLTLIQTFQYGEPQCPTDLFLGRFDEVIDSKKVAQRMSTNPHCQTHWLPNSAHVLPLDNDVGAIITCCTRHTPV